MTVVINLLLNVTLLNCGTYAYLKKLLMIANLSKRVRRNKGSILALSSSNMFHTLVKG